MSAEDDHVVEEVAQEEEKKVATDLEDEMEPLDSSEESDSDEDNAYQEDGFVVADDDGEGALSDEEMNGKDKPSKNRLKRLRKGGKRKRLELDQEDLDLIAFAQGKATSSKVPKVREEAVNADDAHTFSADSGSAVRPPKVKERRVGESTDQVLDELESDGEAMSEDDDFVASDDEDENEDPEERRRRRKERRKRQNIAVNYEHYEDAAAIYNDSWLQDMYDPNGGDDDDDLFDDSEFLAGGPLRFPDAEGEGADADTYGASQGGSSQGQRRRRAAALVDPEILREQYQTAKDDVIRKADIPERFQLQFPGRASPKEEEIAQEAAWIAPLLYDPLTSMHDSQSIIAKVTDVLTFLLNSHYEVSFIEHYRREFWAGTLTPSDLWRIADFDKEWYTLNIRKQALYKALPQDLDIIAADTRLSNISLRTELATSEDAVQDLMDHFNHYSKTKAAQQAAVAAQNDNSPAAPSNGAPQPLEDVVETDDALLENVLTGDKPATDATKAAAATKNSSSTRARPVRTDTLSMATEQKLDRMWTYLQFKPSELAAAVRSGDRLQAEPLSEYRTPLEIAKDFLAPPLFSSAQQVLDGSRTLYAAELSSTPQFRAQLAETFEMYAVVSTKPTPNGRLYIDLQHPYANVRHLQQKPVSSFKNSTLFLSILRAVEEGLISIAISLPKDKMDALRTEIGTAFGIDENLPAKPSADASPAEHWAHYKRKIVLEAISLFMPKLVARTKARLHKDATAVVLNECDKSLEKLLRAGPIYVPGPAQVKRSSSGKRSKKQDDDYVEAPATIAVFCVDDPAKSREVTALVTIVDEHGEIKEVMQVLASLRAEDQIQLREMLRKYMPFAMAVGIDTPLAKKFYSTVADLAAAFVAEEGLDKAIQVVKMPLDLATVYQSTKVAEKEFNNATYALPSPESLMLLRRCASVARRLIDPLMAYASIVTSQDYVLGLDLHAMQKHVSQPALRRRIELTFVKVVSEVGVDLNRVLVHPWMTGVVQFVPGLGPRKAASLLEGLWRPTGDPRVDSRPQLKDTALESSLRPGESLTNVVYDNAIAFIKICGSSSLYIRDWEPLDGTRIHPVAYPIAEKIGGDLKTGGHIKAGEHYATAIARDPSLLRHVDLHALIEKLKTKNLYKELTVRALVEELKAPWADTRVYQDFSLSDLFELVVGKGTLAPGALVTVTTTFLDKQTGSWEVSLPGFISGTISSSDLPGASDDGPSQQNQLRRGQNVQAQVIGVDKELFRVQLTCNIASLAWDAFKVENRDAWLLPEDGSASGAYGMDDLASLLLPASAGASSKPAVITRKIVNRHYGNKTQAEAEEALSQKPVGSFLIHPTTRKQWLTITFKFYFEKFAHLSVEELPSEDVTAPSQYKVENETYEGVDDLVIRFVEPMMANMKELESHTCFSLLNKVDMTQSIQAEKRSNPARAPYHIAPSAEKPGFFVLYYIPGSQTVQKEFVRVTPDGFKYRSILHTSVNRLIAYFKKHYNDPAFLQQQQQQQHHQQQMRGTSLIGNASTAPSAYDDYSWAGNSNPVHYSY